MAPISIVNREDAAHLLRRTGFGPRPGELDALTGMTREQCVDAVMGFTSADPVPPGPDIEPLASVVAADDSNQYYAQNDAIDWWVDRMATLSNRTVLPESQTATAEANPLHEQMVLFWHNHFACSQEKVYDMAVMWDQQRLFRRYWASDFESILRAHAVHPAMLVALDNAVNVAGAEQENFARELMELYTIGVGNFSEPDVVAMAKAWTGHNIVGWTGSYLDTNYQYNGEWHDSGSKTLFGIDADWNGIAMAEGERDTITELCQGIKKLDTARFLARKMFRWFAHLSPSDEVVDELAGPFAESGLSIAVLLRSVLLHDEFWNDMSRFKNITSPVELVAKVIRNAGIPVEAGAIRWNMARMGQTLFEPPSVAGWGTGGYWMSTATAWGRSGAMQNMRWATSEAGLFGELAPMTATDAVTAMFAKFDIETVTPTTRSALESWFNEAKAQAEWSIAPQAFLLTALSPEMQVK